MKLVRYAFSVLSLGAILFACSKDSSPGPTVAPVTEQNTPTAESQPHFSVREVRSSSPRDLGHYISGKDDASISCKLIDVPNSAYGKLFAIEAIWTYQKTEKSDKEFYRVKIESQSPRDMMPGPNSYLFVDTLVRLYKDKPRPATLSDMDKIDQEEYGCDISNFEVKNKTLKGNIQCSEDNIFTKYTFRMNFNCTLD